MLTELIFTLILVYVPKTGGLFEPRIVHGKLDVIEKFPHSVFIHIVCTSRWSGKDGQSFCGGSILNQDIVITAAHCLSECATLISLGLIVGNADVRNGTRYNAVSYVMHPDFNEMGLTDDIGLIRAKKKIVLGKNTKRVAILPHPPHSDETFVAGWGLVNEETEEFIGLLKSTRSKVINLDDCPLSLTEGQLCTKVPDSKVPGENGYAAHGDSGSGLIQDGYIIIGLVSFKNVHIDVSVVAFTNVSTYIPWIQQVALDLYCSNNVSIS